MLVCVSEFPERGNRRSYLDEIFLLHPVWPRLVVQFLWQHVISGKTEKFVKESQQRSLPYTFLIAVVAQQIWSYVIHHTVFDVIRHSRVTLSIAAIAALSAGESPPVLLHLFSSCSATSSDNKVQSARLRVTGSSSVVHNKSKAALSQISLRRKRVFLRPDGSTM